MVLTIVHTNATSHPDLHRALKGGGDNFGVITRYELITFDTPRLDLGWNGLLQQVLAVSGRGRPL